MKKILACLALAASAQVLASDPAGTDIDYWLTKYDGAELRSGKFQCRSPRFPAQSTQNHEIEAVSGRMLAWQTCYNAFVDNLKASPAPDKLVPQDVWARMTAAEREKAVARIRAVQGEIAQAASVKAKIIMADFGAWRAATEAYVNEANEVTRRARENDRNPVAEAQGTQ